jgi:hypothetical protein
VYVAQFNVAGIHLDSGKKFKSWNLVLSKFDSYNCTVLKITHQKAPLNEYC